MKHCDLWGLIRPYKPYQEHQRLRRPRPNIKWPSRQTPSIQETDVVFKDDFGLIVRNLCIRRS